MAVLNPVAPARLTAAAHAAADLLLATAIRRDGRATWLGATVDWVDGAPGVVRRTGDATLYDGSAGVALAARAAATALERDDLAALATEAARHAVDAAPRVPGPGLFDGRAGIGYVALTAGDDALRAPGRALLLAAAEETSASGLADLVSGSAGVLVALLDATRATGDEALLAAAARQGEALLGAVAPGPDGTWPALTGSGPALCGLAHGAAGAAWALGELAAVSGDPRLHDAVARARRFERRWFRPSENGWPDLRPESLPPGGGPAPCPALWCHGATGIGLSRLALHALDAHPSLAAEAACALQAAGAAAEQALAGGPPETGLTVCHGLGGTVLLLLAAHAELGEPEHLDAGRWVAAQALDRLGPDPEHWPGGVPGGAFSPGLMTGLAGALHALARAARPAARRPSRCSASARLGLVEPLHLVQPPVEDVEEPRTIRWLASRRSVRAGSAPATAMPSSVAARAAASSSRSGASPARTSAGSSARSAASTRNAASCLTWGSGTGSFTQAATAARPASVRR